MEGNKRILYIVAEQFRDEEVLEPLRILREAGHDVDLAGPQRGTICGMLGASLEINQLVAEVDSAEYDLLVLPGGDGTPALREHEPLLELVRSFVDAGKGIGAICWAPTILAKLGLLDGHEVAVCHIPDAGEYDGLQTQEVVQQAGARIASQGVARSGLFITGSGPRAAAAFAQKLLEYLDELPDTAL